MPEITVNNGPQKPTMRWFEYASLVLLIYAFAGGLISFAGWGLDIPRLTDWDGYGISIQPNAAIAGIAASLGVIFFASRLSYLSFILGLLVCFLGISTFFQIVTEIDLGFNDLLMFGREWGRRGVIVPGRMGTPGSISWTLIGIAISLSAHARIREKSSDPRQLRLVSVSLALTTAAISALSITGYLYGAESLYTLPQFTVIAFQTATFILALSLAIIFRITDVGPMKILGDDSPTGRMFRRIVPAIIVAPVLLSLIQLAGEGAGLYGRAFGITSATIIEIALLLALLWWTGQTVVDTEARKTAMFQTALDCIVSIDHRGKVIEFNQAAESTFGYKRDDVMGRELANLIIPPSQRDQHRNGLAQYLKTGEGPVIDKRIEVQAVRKDGSEFPVELSITRIRVGGSPEFTAYLRDITERKNAEAAMQHAKDVLEERVEERTAELSATNEALHRSNHELEQFASIASHDLQEPLRKIQAFGDRLQTKYAEGLGEQGAAYVSKMQISAARMRTLIDSLLTFARVTTKAQEFVPVELAEIAADVVSDLESRIATSGGRVEIGHLPTIDADPLQMRQLFQNLIGNGLKFHKPHEPPVVRVTYRTIKHGKSKREFCEIQFADNGIGIEEEYKNRIFEVFQRLHGRHEFEGTGMGLAICRKITDRHFGTITVESTPGGGSTFSVTLPVKQIRDEDAN